eukprot:COSAG01_NODE_739_length_13898_cov_29.871223_8_plen_143_part_00
MGPALSRCALPLTARHGVGTGAAVFPAATKGSTRLCGPTARCSTSRASCGLTLPKTRRSSSSIASGARTHVGSVVSRPDPTQPRGHQMTRYRKGGGVVDVGMFLSACRPFYLGDSGRLGAHALQYAASPAEVNNVSTYGYWG